MYSILKNGIIDKGYFTFYIPRLDGVDENAYDAFQASRDLKDVVDRVMKLRTESGGKPGMSKKLSVRANLMTPVLPMLVKSVLHIMF